MKNLYHLFLGLMPGAVLVSANVWAALSAESNLYMGASITLVEAPNGAIANKRTGCR